MTEDRDETSPENPREPPEKIATDAETGRVGGPAQVAEVTETTAEPAGQGIESHPDALAGSAGEAIREPAPDPPNESLDEALPLVEALLFAAAKPVALDKLAEAAELPEAVVVEAVAALEAACAVPGRGVRMDRVAGGLRLVTRPEYDYPVRRLLGLEGRTKLSMAALETLAIVAYRQPVTGPEIAELRSVNSSSSIRTLLDRKLITTAGRKEVVGTPFLYKTTKEFLVHFGLMGLGDLPKPEELEAIYGLEVPKTDPAQTELFHVDEATGEVEDVEGPEAIPAGPDAEEPTAAAEPRTAGNDEPAPAPEAAPEEERHDG
jgi:segregation and condensation protein B